MKWINFMALYSYTLYTWLSRYILLESASILSGRCEPLIGQLRLHWWCSEAYSCAWLVIPNMWLLFTSAYYIKEINWNKNCVQLYICIVWLKSLSCEWLPLTHLYLNISWSSLSFQNIHYGVCYNVFSLHPYALDDRRWAGITHKLYCGLPGLPRTMR